jgi:hypothetical protein
LTIWSLLAVVVVAVKLALVAEAVQVVLEQALGYLLFQAALM